MIEILLKSLDNRGRSDGAGVSDGVQHAAVSFVAKVHDGAGDLAVLGRRIGAEVERIGLEQIILQRGVADVVEIGLAGFGVGLQRLDDVLLALIERLLAGLADIERDEQFIGAGWVSAWMRAFFSPARSSSARIALTLGFWVNLMSTMVPPRKSTPSGM